MPKKNLKIIFILGTFFIFPNLVWGAPSITGVSGVVTNGQTLIIFGNSFGTKSTANPYRWDNFEQGSSGDLVAGWSGGTGSDIARYSDDIQRGPNGHIITSKHEFRPLRENISLCQNDYANGYDVLYIDYWYRLTPVDSSGISGRNYKPWRVWTNDITMQFNPGTCPPVEPYGPAGIFSIYDNGFPNPPEVNIWNGEDRDYGNWKHEQSIIRVSDPGMANGVLHRYVNSQPIGPFSDSLIFRTRNILPTEIRIGHYWATDADPGDPETLPSNTGADVYIDDLYIDRTWSRVEIGDASTYSACTHREIQIPSSWSSNSINFTVNQGSFNNGISAYLYVTDSNDETNINGYPLIFNSTSGDITPPGNPQGLSVL
ncbi:MAG: hypothetical protein V3574_03885 [Candidatus Moraniibacteriota bacterium]